MSVALAVFVVVTVKSVLHRPGHLNTWSPIDGHIWKVLEACLCWYKSLDENFRV